MEWKQLYISLEILKILKILCRVKHKLLFFECKILSYIYHYNDKNLFLTIEKNHDKYIRASYFEAELAFYVRTILKEAPSGPASDIEPMLGQCWPAAWHQLPKLTLALLRMTTVITNLFY